MKNVRINRRASSIARHLYFIGTSELTSQDLYNGVADALTVGANEIVETLQRSTIAFEAK